MSFFEQTTKAAASRDGNYVREGNFIARIDKIAEGVIKHKGNAPFLKFEMTILKVLGPVATKRPDSIPAASPHIDGESVTWMLMQAQTSSPGNVKAALLCLAETTEAESAGDVYHDIYHMAVDAENATFVAKTGEDKGKTFQRNLNLFAGTVVEVVAVDKVKQKSLNKSPDKLTRNDDIFTGVSFKRVLKPSEYAPLISDKIKELQFPGDTLDNLLAAESADET